jgi:hypothetical protein
MIAVIIPTKAMKAGGCFTNSPTPVDSSARGGSQFKKEQQVQKADDAAVDVLQKS